MPTLCLWKSLSHLKCLHFVRTKSVLVEAAIAEIVHRNLSFNSIIIFVLTSLFEESTNVTCFYLQLILNKQFQFMCVEIRNGGGKNYVQFSCWRIHSWLFASCSTIKIAHKTIVLYEIGRYSKTHKVKYLKFSLNL